MALGPREGAVFRGIGHQFVQDEAEIDGGTGRKTDLRSPDRDAFLGIAPVRGDLVFDDGVQIGRAPGVPGQQVMGLRESEETALEGLPEFGGCDVERRVCPAID